MCHWPGCHGPELNERCARSCTSPLTICQHSIKVPRSRATGVGSRIWPAGYRAHFGAVERAAKVPPVFRYPGVDAGTEEGCPGGVQQWQEGIEAGALPHDPAEGEETSEYLPARSYNIHGVIGIGASEHGELRLQQLAVIGIVKMKQTVSGEPLQKTERPSAEATLRIVNDIQTFVPHCLAHSSPLFSSRMPSVHDRQSGKDLRPVAII